MAAWNSNGLTTRTVTGTSDVLLFTDDVVIYTNTAAKSVAISGSNDSRLQKGKVYFLSNQATGDITVTPASGTIDGAATLTVVATTGRAQLVFDGTNWFTI